MDHHTQLHQDYLAKLTPEMKSFLNKTRAELKGTERRQFMARVVSLMEKEAKEKPKENLAGIVILSGKV